jgi:hypothetical protein
MRSERRILGLNKLEPVRGELGQESAFGGNALLWKTWSTWESLSTKARHLDLVKKWTSQHRSNEVQDKDTLFKLLRQRQLPYLHSP